MGMAASQARLLTITARMHDVEYQAQSIQNAKIALATQEDEVYREYLDALDQTTFTVKDNNNQTVVANFNTLCGINAARATSKERYLLRDDKNSIIVSEEISSGYKAFEGKGNNAYEFAMFMLDGQPSDFDRDKYAEKEKEIFNTNNNKNALPKNIADIRDNLVDKVYELYDLLKDGSENFSALFNADNADDVKNIIRGDLTSAIATIKSAYEGYKSAMENGVENSYTDAIAEHYNSASKIMDGIDTQYETFEYLMYSTYGEEIYEGAGNSADDFQSDDFWYYVNLYKQIEANGGRITTISEFDGIDGIGNAATDSDWLKNAIQSGKITIDISTLDNKGQINFRSTGVPSDSALEYTTTSTIDKTALAKAEAEYEHKMKEIDQKDKKFDMDLSKLETERNALSTEYESVKKVVDDNIKRTFGIFS